MKPVLERELWSDCEPDAADVDPCLPRDERRMVELKGYVIRSDKRIVDVQIVDLSYDGCAVRTLIPLAPGERLKLSVLGQGAVTAVVRWYKSRRAGLLFVSDRSSRTRWPRKAERIAVRAELSLRRSGRLSYHVKLFDVTRFGCKCEFVERPSVYERVWVKFDGLERLESTVCWVEESSLGLVFSNPVHPAVFELLLEQLRAQQPCD